MRNVVAIVVVAGVIGFVQMTAAGQGQGKGKGNGGNNAPALRGWFGDGAVSSDGDFVGTLFDGQLDTSQAVTVFFDCPNITPQPDAPPFFPGCEAGGDPSGTLVGIGINAMQALVTGSNLPDCIGGTVGCDGYARQAFISWTVGKTTYRLQYGNVDTQPDPPNYAHVQCLEVVDGACHNATADDVEGWYDSTVPQDVITRRRTGPVAMLLEGKGRLREVGLYRVPFSFELCGEGASCFPPPQ